MQSIRLRRLRDDSELLTRKLFKIEEWVAAKKLEPWVGVLMAEWERAAARHGPEEQSQLKPPTLTEMEALLLDPDLVAVMREQAEGPWAVYVTQAQGTQASRHFASALSELGASSEPAGADQHRDVVSPSEREPTRVIPMKKVLFPNHQWDVVVSYATADSDIVNRAVEPLVKGGLRVFYAPLEKITSQLLGRDLKVELPRIYGEQAAYCIVFISENYAKSVWARLELESALTREIANEEYIKPVRLDDAKVDLLPESIAYLDARPGRQYSDPVILSAMLLTTIKSRAHIDPSVHLPEIRRDELTVEEYFAVVLPAMLRWSRPTVTSVNASVLFVVSGPDPGTWLVQFSPTEPAVVPITENHDVRAMLHSRNLQIRITRGEMQKMFEGAFDARKALVEGNVGLTGDLTLLREVGEVLGKRVGEPQYGM